MFKREMTLQNLNEIGKGNMVEYLGIEFTEIGPDYLVAKMPVDHRTRQPFGILHGGASVALAESMGSLASFLSLDPNSTQKPVGLEINANHLKAAKSGWVYGKVLPIHIGSRTHVWEIQISDENQKRICVSRITVMIID